MQIKGLFFSSSGQGVMFQSGIALSREPGGFVSRGCQPGGSPGRKAAPPPPRDTHGAVSLSPAVALQTKELSLQPLVPRSYLLLAGLNL